MFSYLIFFKLKKPHITKLRLNMNFVSKEVKQAKDQRFKVEHIKLKHRGTNCQCEVKKGRRMITEGKVGTWELDWESQTLTFRS